MSIFYGRFKADQVQIYPSANATDGGQFNKEEFISKLAKNATKTNHVIREESDESEYFTLGQNKGQGEAICTYITNPGLCIINGYLIEFTSLDRATHQIEVDQLTGSTGVTGLVLHYDAAHLASDYEESGVSYCDAIKFFIADSLSDLEGRDYLLLGNITSKNAGGVSQNSKKYVIYNFTDNDIDLHRIVLQDTPQAKVVIDDNPENNNEVIGMTVDYTPQGGGRRYAKYGVSELELTIGSGGTSCLLSPTSLNLNQASGKAAKLNFDYLQRTYKKLGTCGIGDPITIKYETTNPNTGSKDLIASSYTLDNSGNPNGGLVGVCSSVNSNLTTVTVEGFESALVNFLEDAFSGSLLYADYDSTTSTTSIKVLNLNDLPSSHSDRYDCIGYLLEDVSVSGDYEKTGLTLEDLGLYNLDSTKITSSTKITFKKSDFGEIFIDEISGLTLGIDYNFLQLFDYDILSSSYGVDNNSTAGSKSPSSEIMGYIEAAVSITSQQRQAITSPGLYLVGINKDGLTGYYATSIEDIQGNIPLFEGSSTLQSVLGITVDVDIISYIVNNYPEILAFYTFLQVGMPVDGLSDLPFTEDICEASLIYDNTTNTYGIKVGRSSGITQKVKVYVSPQTLIIQ